MAIETPHFHVDLKKLRKNLKRLQHKRAVVNRASKRALNKLIVFDAKYTEKADQLMLISAAIENILNQIRLEENQHVSN